MTDEELQEFIDQQVRLTYDGHSLTGKLISGFEVQLSVKAPYAIEWTDRNAAIGTYELHRVGIPSADRVESIEALNESALQDAEVEDAAKDQQTPG
jgi:hypothetical protein